jgi:hypothetical protein
MCASSSAGGSPHSSGGPGGGGCTRPADAGQATASCSGGHPQTAAASAVDSAVRTPAAVPPASWTPDTAAAVRVAAPGHGRRLRRTPRRTGWPRHCGTPRPSRTCVRPCPAPCRNQHGCGLRKQRSRTGSGRAAQSPCPRWLPQGPPVSTLVAGVRSAAGHPSEPKIAADTGVAIDTSLATSAGHQPSGGQWFRKQRTVNPLVVPAVGTSSARPQGRPAGGTRRFRGRPYRRRRTSVALPLKCASVNLNSKMSDLATNQTSQISS